MKMLLELASVDDIDEWVEQKLDEGERIMGLGHAVYKTQDPRANFLREMGQRLGEKTGRKKWQNISMRLEKAVLKAFDKRKRSNLYPNVDFCSAPVYYIMGIPLDLMTPLFAIARIPGWCAHIIEEKFGDAQEKPLLYRPKAEYIGDYCGLMGCIYRPTPDRME
jgi:citrate synthase